MLPHCFILCVNYIIQLKKIKQFYVYKRILFLIKRLYKNVKTFFVKSVANSGKKIYNH